MKKRTKAKAATRKAAVNRTNRDAARATAARALGPSPAPVAVEVPAVVPAPPDVPALLAASRAAHEAYQAGVLGGDPVAKRTALLQAYDRRLAAHLADPTLLDPAWQGESLRYPTVNLLAFYRSELAKL